MSHPCLWLITWDPTQPTATRPLAIQKDGTWYCYGWDLTKNICEVFGQAGYIRTTYSYAPYGSVTEEGDVAQPLQWSSEYADPELGLVYYNYRYYNPTDGRWIRRDPDIRIVVKLLYCYVKSSPLKSFDELGLRLFCCPSPSYKSAQEAAQEAHRLWNPVFIDENLEHGGYICECRAWFGMRGPVYYFTHVRGTPTGMNPDLAKCDSSDIVVADWHTHAAYDPDYDNENFSDLDKDSNNNMGIPGYLSTPSGIQKFYDLRTGKEYNL